MRKVNEITGELVMNELFKNGFQFMWFLGMMVFSSKKSEQQMAEEILKTSFEEGTRVFLNYNKLCNDRKTKKGIKRDLDILLQYKK